MYILEDVAYYYERGDELQFLGASKKDTMKKEFLLILSFLRCPMMSRNCNNYKSA